MRIVIAGGTGFIGQALAAALVADGMEVVVLTRQPDRRRPQGVEFVPWQPPAAPVAALDGAEAVVNLAGAPIARRWSPAAKDLILVSRVESTRALVQAMAETSTKPRVFVNASAVGYYGSKGDDLLTEATPAGDDFLAGVCQQWEVEAEAASGYGVRVVRARIGLVIGRGGALRLMALPFHLFVGGPLGSGQQWMPWIHLDDVVGLMRFALENENIRGALNVTGPEPIRNQEFAQLLGRALRRPAAVPVPAFALRAILGEMADMVLGGQRALPQKALAAGYAFRFPTPQAALADMFGK